MVLSLFLHGAMALVFVWQGFGVGDGVPAKPDPVVVQVTLVPRSPQRSEAAPLPVDAPAEPVQEPVIAVEEQRQVAEPPREESLQELVQPAVSEDETSTLSEQLSEAPDARQLQNAVARYMQDYRSNGVERWVDACRRLRPRAPDAPPCPDEQLTGDARRLQQQVWAAELFVTPQSRRAESERLYRQMVAESRYLETLVDDNTVLGQLARERFAALKEHYCALNEVHAACSPGGFADPLTDVITLISVGSP